MKEKRDGEQGQALLEFALVLPVLLLFLMAIVDFGRIASAHLIVGQAARDVARYASIGDTDADLNTIYTNDTSVLGSAVSMDVTPVAQRTSGNTVTVTIADTVDIFDPIMAAILGKNFAVSTSVTMRVE